MTTSKRDHTCHCGKPGDFGRGMCQNHYNERRRREIAYGRWEPRVLADETRAHVEQLQAVGVNPFQLAQLAGISKTTIKNVLDPQVERISAETARAIQAVDIPARASDITEDKALVPILGAQRRIQALVAYGYPQNHLARQIGIRPGSTTMSALVGRPNLGGGSTGVSVTAAHDRAIKEVFDRLQLVPGPSARARDYGARRGWALPLEWDEAELDDPAAQPIRARWTPASALAERREQVHELTSRGMSAGEIATRLRIEVYVVTKDRQRGPITVGGHLEMDRGVDR